MLSIEVAAQGITRQETTDTRGFQATAYFDKGGRLIKTEEEISSSEKAMTQFQYDLKDQLHTIVDPIGTAITYTLGVGGRVLEILRPGSHQVFTYDSRGNRLSANVGNGIINYQYDPWNRLTRIDYPGNAYDALSYAFFQTALGNGERRIASRYENGSLVNEVTSLFDPLGQLRSETWTLPGVSGNLTMQYGYDGAGRQTRVRIPTIRP